MSQLRFGYGVAGQFGRLLGRLLSVCIGRRFVERLSLALLLLCSASAYAAVSNVYDELGRLVQVVAPDGASVQYKYDAVGNITEVKRFAANALALTEFTPNAGPTGTAVTIYGSGFSAVPADNTVKFNGKAATVQSATANVLTVKVPAGATTGRITVSNTRGQVTSATDFVTGADRPIPVITSITPDIGKPAEILAIAGNNFQPAVADNVAAFAAGPAQIIADADSPSATLLKAKIPSGAPSGPISVATRFGKSANSADFYAVPGTHLVADIEFKARAKVDGALVPLSITTPGKKAIVIFDGKVGQYLGLVTSGGTFASNPSVEVYRPDGVRIETSSYVYGSGVFDFSKPLPVNGTYTLVFVPASTEKGTVNLGLAASIQGALTVDAPSPTLSTMKVGQNARYTFTGVTGKNLQLLLTNSTLDDGNTGTNNYTYVYVYKPDGTQLAYAYQYTSDRPGQVLTLPTLPVDGTYTVLVRPDNLDEGQIKLHLKTANSGTVLPTDGTATTINVADQELGYYRFTGVAGKGYGLALKDLVFTPGTNSPSVTAYLYKPDGTLATYCTLYSSTLDCDFAPSNFTADGTYGLVFVPRYLNSVSFKAQLGKDVGTELKIDAAAPTTATLKAGQNARYTFTGVTGKNLQLLLTNSTLDDGNTGTNNYTYVYVYKPDGNQLTYAYQYTSDRPGQVLSLPTLPVDGTYTVLVNPDNLDEGQIKLHLKTANSGTALPTDGTATTINVADQELGYYRFTGVAGKGYGLGLKDLVFTPGTNSPSVTAYLYKPDGTLATYCTLYSSTLDCDFAPSNFTADGTYGLVFVPRYLNSVSFKAQLGKDVGTELKIDAAAPTTATLKAGQNARYTFTGVTGKNLQLLLTNSTLDDGNTGTNNYTYVYVYKPDGNQLTYAYQYTSDRPGQVLSLPTLPVDGTYTVLVNPDNLDEGQIKLHLKTANSGTALPTDGTATTINVADQELGYYRFTGVAGKGYGLGLKDLVFTPGTNSPYVMAYLYKPDGSLATSCTLYSSTLDCDFAPSYFTADGTYGLVFVPRYLNSVSFKAQLDKDVGTELKIDAAAPTTATLKAGQNARYTFTGVTGKNLQLLLTNSTLDDGNTGTNNYTYVYVYKPDGSQLASAYQYTSDRPGQVLSLPTLPVDGTYSVLVAPDNLDEGQIKLHLKTANSGTALPTDGTATAVNVADQELGYYRFNGVAGKGYGLALKDLVFTPGTNSPNVTAYLYKPDGTLATSCAMYGSTLDCDFAPSYFTADGTYGLVFVPRYLNSVSFKVQLGKDVGSQLTVDAAQPTTATLSAGQNARYTFTGVAGKNLQLLLTNSTLDDGNTGTNNYTYVYVYKPDGGQLTYTYQYSNDRPAQVLWMPTLPVDGTYTVLVAPDNLDEGQIKLHLKTANSGSALPTDGTATAMNVADQELGYYRFTGVAGKGYGLALKDLVFTPGTNSPNVTAYLYRPDGSYVTSCSFSSAADCDLAPSYFTADGTYGLVFVPRYLNSASFKVQLGKDVGSQLTVDAAQPTTATLSAGQNARYTFTGVAGKNLQLLLTNSTLDDGNTGTNNYTYVYVYKPDGGQLTYTYQYSSDRSAQVLWMPTLPVDGTYTVLVAPDNLDEGQIKLHLKTANSGTALPIDGTPTAVNVADQELGYYRFAGVAGKGYGFALKDLVFTPGTNSPNVTAYLYKADGSYVTSCSLTTAGDCDFAPSYFTVDGTYGLVFVPRYLNSASFKVQFAKDAGGDLVVDAAQPTTLALSAGQNARYTFNGVAGGNLQLLLTNNTLDDGNTGTTTYTYVYVYKPDGSQLTYTYINSNDRSAQVLWMPTLPVGGTYTVLISTDNLDEGQIKLHLKTANTGTALPTDGSATPVSVADLALGYYRIAGVAGKAYSVALNNLVFTPGTNSPTVGAYLYKPDGTYVGSCTFYSSQTGCDFGAGYFPTSGDYGLVFVPKFQNSAQFNAAVTAH